MLRDASVPSPGDASFPVLILEQVVRYFRDPQDPEKGEKVALKKALQHLDMAIPPARFHMDTSIFTEIELNDLHQLAAADRKIRRRLFWEAYLNRKKAVQTEAS